MKTRLFRRKKKRISEADDVSKRISFYYEASIKWWNRYCELLLMSQFASDDDPHREELELAREFAWSQYQLAKRMFISASARDAVWGEP